MLSSAWAEVTPMAEADRVGPAKARAALLSQGRPPMRSGVGKLYVGSCESAVQWASSTWTLVSLCGRS